MKTNYVYPARIIHENEELLLSFIDFPDLIASGTTEEELLEAAQEILALAILDYVDQGKEPPKPSYPDERAIYVNVWLPYYKNMAKVIYIKKTVTIPQWLDILAKENNVNYSACMVRGIKEELGID